MLEALMRFVERHEPNSATLVFSIKAGIGGTLGISAAGGLADATGLPFLLAPFGASCVLLFAHPTSPLAQPANAIGGYLLATIISVGTLLSLPITWWAAAIGVGMAIGLMSVFRLTHPPAGAIPIVAMTSTVSPALFLAVVSAGSVLMVAIAWIYHRVPPRHVYPKHRSR